MELKIAQLGQPVLWQAAALVPPAEILTAEFQQLLNDMHETLQANQGAGLAGPQVFVSRQVFLGAILPPPSEDEPPEVEVFINPRITAIGAETSTSWEGCLSFPELLVQVSRLTHVHIDYLDAFGEARALDLEGFPARVVQHEFDHLQGVLTLDRAQSTRHIIKASEADDVLERKSS